MISGCNYDKMNDQNADKEGELVSESKPEVRPNGDKMNDQTGTSGPVLSSKKYFWCGAAGRAGSFLNSLYYFSL